MLSAVAWGKLTRDESDVVDRLGLLEHCIDVAAVVCALFQVPNIRHRLESLAGRQLNDVDLDRLILIAFLHDVGKACSGFQSKCLVDKDRRALLYNSGIRDPEDCGHTRVIGGILNNYEDQERLLQVIPLGEIQEWAGLDLWLASISHHGQPITWPELENQRVAHGTWRPLEDYDPWKALAELGKAARKLFPRSFDESADTLPEIPEFIHAYAGLVSIADWIGSDARDNAFPYDLGSGYERWPLSQTRAAYLLREMCIDVDNIREDLRRRSPNFGEVFRDECSQIPFVPNELQREMSADDLDRIVVVESETGSGKTEAALWRFKCLFERGEVDSLAFVLPTRVSAVQIEKRVNHFIKALFPDKHLRPNVLLALPGYWRVDGDEGKGALPGFKVLWPDGNDEKKAHRRWAAENTKRYLAACCAVGSIDQVLLSGLKTRHSHLRGFVLLRSLLVVDEVHASDAYMSVILTDVLRRHREAGGHALLLSATLGLAARDGFLGRCDVTQGGQSAYPCVSDSKSVRKLGAPDWSKEVHVETRPLIDEPRPIAEIAALAVKQGARVLVVRNSVHDVIEVHKALEEILGHDDPALFRAGLSGVTCPHHGRYAAADRRLLDQAVEEVFGKNASERASVLVGSQTLEQSLDIDADLLITDLAPIDVLLQRFGRLHRHRSRDKHRPEAFREPHAIVLVPGTRDLIEYTKTARHKHGFAPERAYENLPSVDATWELLEASDTMVIPDQNRQLVEFATDPRLLEQRAHKLGAAWQEYWHIHIGSVLARRQNARLVICDWADDWDDSAFPGSEQMIQTRLGISAARIEFDELLLSPFGQQLSEISVPNWMIPKAVDPDTILAEKSDCGIRLKCAGFELRYARFGLEKVR